jgi:glycosyltransferase involved in cell wall biosynthesis
VFVVENGANTDEMDFTKINGRPDHFSIVYSGTIYDQQMEDISFFKMLARFVRVKHILPANFKVYFIGSSGNSRLHDVIHQYHLDDYVHITERVSLDRLYGYMYEASMFLHLRYSNRSEIITSKQYDYLALQKPILLPVSDKGDIAESIRRHKAGFVCNSEEGIYEVLEMQWQAYLDGSDVRLYRRKEELYRISRQYQVERLNQILREKLPNKFNLELTTIY